MGHLPFARAELQVAQPAARLIPTGPPNELPPLLGFVFQFSGLRLL